jgi:NADH-quinone oxidoreductase subunit C
MAEEEKKPDSPVPPAVPESAAPVAGGEKPPASKSAAPAAKPAAPAGPAAQPWDDELARRVRERFGPAIKESLTYLGQNYFVVDAAAIVSICGYLKHEEEFNYLVDLTAVDYPKREKRFEVVYTLYSFPRNTRVRVKASIAENEPIESVTPVWQTANWLEREAYDMFGIRFSGHPDLKRILLPDGWQGFPLRKDYSIIQQDTQWVRENLHIESGQ